MWCSRVSLEPQVVAALGPLGPVVGRVVDHRHAAALVGAAAGVGAAA